MSGRGKGGKPQQKTVVGGQSAQVSLPPTLPAPPPTKRTRISWKGRAQKAEVEIIKAQTVLRDIQTLVERLPQQQRTELEKLNVEAHGILTGAGLDLNPDFQPGGMAPNE
jgi:hypothetical protein